ncbi:DUF4291 domain-containing protein [Enterococcus sp. LJL128]|uniref:DUF4291 domain-containing protein n=1 Tax=Enterococcus sp. LJL51 TaxID=3416656 RepID=UPI003CEE0CF9
MEKKIYASFNSETIRVYQAYNHKIAAEATSLGHFGPSFKLERMTWIKPSFLWMMYRSGWASKEGQERVLAIDITIDGFRELLKHVVLSTYDEQLYPSYESWQKKVKSSEVRCQWDPDKDLHLEKMERKAIQLGLRGKMVEKYVRHWTTNITDITEEVHQMKNQIDAGSFDMTALPKENEFPLSVEEKRILGIQETSH